MLRIIPCKGGAAAKAYFTGGLGKEDYYSEGQEIIGIWHGKAAAFLGLSGEVKPEEFAALVDNRHPKTGERLTPNTKMTRVAGWDFNFHACKGLSLLYALTGDEKLLVAFRKAVAETMAEIEEHTATRVRKRGAQEDRLTGNLAFAEFVHLTSRPVGGKPDPHLHIHAWVPNLTYDKVEQQWKAAKIRDIKKEAPYSQAIFHSKLADELVKLGFGVERAKVGFEIAGISPSILAKFSRRTAEIEELARKKGITDPKAKDALGARSRAGKRHGLKYTDLIAEWGSRLTDAEKAQIFKVHDRTERFTRQVTPEQALDYACEKLFAKDSVVPKNRILAAAMWFGVGHTTPENIQTAFDRRDIITRKIKDEVLCTTAEVLAEEVALINFVRNGRTKFAALAPNQAHKVASYLSVEQKAAAKHILECRDQVIAVRGGAGVGKTTALKEVIPIIEATGKKVFVYAPSARASRGNLKDEGFDEAQTVAHLLLNTKMQQQVRGQIIWLDEAGLIGIPDISRIKEIMGKDGRLILTGDTRQHLPVQRGDTYRILQEKAGMRVVEITKIRRQNRQEYKEAVAALARGDLRMAFRRLDKMGAIHEIQNPDERYRQLAADYLALDNKRPPLVVSPTHSEAGKVTEAIREAKRGAGRLGSEREFTQYHNLQWEIPDRALPENYQAGMVVQFHQNAKGFLRGELVRVVGKDKERNIQVERKDGRKATLSMKDAARFLVYEERKIKLGKGDAIKITRNEHTVDGRRINNGDTFKIDRITKKGELVLNTGAILGPNHGHLAYGYCQTSHSSQSTSVRDVLIAQKQDSGLAASLNQFYVSASRAKESIRIYTDNRQGLQQSVGNLSKRMAGVELAQLSQKDISSMNGMDSKQWREWVQKRRGDVEGNSFAENLRKQRGGAEPNKQPTKTWESFVKMRRDMVGPDGKSRSKGHPAEPGKQKRTPKPKWAPTNELSKSFFEKVKAAKKTQNSQPETRSARPSSRSTVERYRSHLRYSKGVYNKTATRSTDANNAKRPPPDFSKAKSQNIPNLKPTNTDEARVAKRQVAQKRNQSAKKTNVKIPPPTPQPPRRGR